MRILFRWSKGGEIKKGANAYIPMTLLNRGCMRGIRDTGCNHDNPIVIACTHVQIYYLYLNKKIQNKSFIITMNT